MGEIRKDYEERMDEKTKANKRKLKDLEGELTWKF